MRIFHVISGFENGGVEALIYRAASCAPSDAELHIVAHAAPSDTCVNRFRALGATVHFVPCRKRYFAHKRALYDLFLKYRPDVVHVHTTEWGYLALGAAKRAGVPIRIQHSHAARVGGSPLLSLFFKWSFSRARSLATGLVACGGEAAERSFGRRAVARGECIVLPNSIDTAHFAFSPERRVNTRAALGIGDDTVVVGMVARFSPQKNHEAALRIFAAYHEKQPNSVLLLVGGGERLAKIKALAKKRLPADAVIFYGIAEDTAPLYDAMDVFLLPSRFEGLPITLVEAQCSGLVALVSEAVTREAALTDLVRFLPVGSVEAWCAALGDLPLRERGAYAARVAACGYDASDTADFYSLYT